MNGYASKVVQSVEASHGKEAYNRSLGGLTAAGRHRRRPSGHEVGRQVRVQWRSRQFGSEAAIPVPMPP